MRWREIVRSVSEIIDMAGVTVMVIGLTIAIGAYLLRIFKGDRSVASYRAVRRGTGRAILLGLEFLVAADIIRTVAVDPSFTSVGVLAIIVAIRTFLAFTLELDVSGRWPWQQEPLDDEAPAHG